MSDQDRVRVVEVLSVLVIIVSVSLVAMPKFADLERRETATRVLADVEVVRNAVFGFHSDSAYFPPESPTGSIPENLVPYLPPGFSFQRSYGTIEYKNWPVRAPQEGTGAANVIGANLTTQDPRIAATAAALSPGTARFVVGNTYTFLFFGS